MYAYIQPDAFNCFTVDNLRLFILYFADDTVLFSYSKEGLQLSLNKLNEYSKQWGVTVNTDKN